ncbi:hypothetical protein NVP1244A_102 [Vibrio phage 1.244.A._10N.261.54.C3]|nr:hypothetical protein NVP1244A_102 [Vibrio phage 1.244.A._10N.261.54.C3]AUR98730.1 hypothetical protein NVP1255O_102 [Vibrio phage 1.255.O._10N.286.45.F1]
MKPVSGFLADNGKFFEDETECVNYEQFINLRKTVTDMRPQQHGLSGTGNANDTLTKFIEELITGYPEMIIAMAERHTIKIPAGFEPTHTTIDTDMPVIIVDKIDSERTEVEFEDGSRAARYNFNIRPIGQPSVITQEVEAEDEDEDSTVYLDTIEGETTQRRAINKLN